MVYKFRSLVEPDLSVTTKDSDGDLVTVNFESLNGSSGGQIGIFETEETKIAEGLKADGRCDKLYYFCDKKKSRVKKEPEPILAVEEFAIPEEQEPVVTVSVPKTSKTSKKRKFFKRKK